MDQLDNPANLTPLEELVREAYIENDNPSSSDEDANPFRLIDLEELVNRPPKPYLVEQWFGYSDHCMIYGDSGCGKTFLVVDLIVRGALGLPVANQFKTARPFKTLYCSEEGNAGIGPRFKAATSFHGLDPASEAGRMIGHFEIVPKLFYDDEAEEGLEHFIKAVQNSGFGPDIIIFDTLADLSEGSNENDNGHIATINRRTRRIRQRLGCSTMYVHHTPKNDPTSSRGGGASKGKADLMLLASGADGVRSLECKKLKDGFKFGELAWKLEAHGASAIVQWVASERPPLRKDTKSLNIIEVVRILRQNAPSEDLALKADEVHALMESPPTKRVVGDYLKELRGDERTVIKGKQVQILDKNGKRNNCAWFYWFGGEVESS